MCMVNFWGFDFEGSYRVTDDLTLFANAGHDRARIISNIQVSGGPVDAYYNELSEVPKWTCPAGPLMTSPIICARGISRHYVGRRFQTEDNNAWYPTIIPSMPT